MKLCFNSIAYKKTGTDTETILRQTAGLGEFQALEILQPHYEHLSREQAEDLAALAAELGLELPIVSGYLGVLRQEMDDFGEHLELCRRLSRSAGWLGVKMHRAFAGFVGEVSSLDPDPEYYKYVIRGFKEICRILADSGQVLATEVHRGCFTDTAAGSLKFLEDVGAENHKLLLQLGVVPRQSGTDGIGLYRALQSHVVHMHINPYPGEEHEDNPKNMAGLLPLLEKENAPFYVSIENCEAHVPPLQAARDGAALVKRILGEDEAE